MSALARTLAVVVLAAGSLLGGALLGPPTATAQSIMTVSPYFMEADDPVAIEVVSGLIPGGVMILPQFTGTFWATVPLRLPSTRAMNRIVLCYRTSNSRSFITQVRTTYMREPTSANIELDDATDLTSTAPDCVTTEGFVNPFDGTMSLGIRFDFADLADTIHIGGIGIELVPYTVDAPTPKPIERFQLLPNVPNPFAGETVISYRVPQPGSVSIRVYDVSGRAVRELAVGEQPAGEHRLVWDGRDDAGARLPAGVYFYQARAGAFTDERRMVLAR